MTTSINRHIGLPTAQRTNELIARAERAAVRQASQTTRGTFFRKQTAFATPYDGPFAVSATSSGTKVSVARGPIHVGVSAWSWWPDNCMSVVFTAAPFSRPATHNQIAPVDTERVLYMTLAVNTSGAFDGTYYPHLEWGGTPYNTSGMNVQLNGPSSYEVWIPLALVSAVNSGGYKVKSIWQIHHSGIQVVVTYEATGFGRYASLETKNVLPP